MCYLGRRRCCYHLPCTEGDTKAPRELASSGGAGRALWFSVCSWGHGRSGGYVTRSGPLTWGPPGVPTQASGFLAWGFFLEISLPLRTKYLNQGARLWLEISSGCLVFLHFYLCHWRRQDAPANRSDLGFEGSVLPGQPAVGSADTVPSVLGTNQPSCSTPGIHSCYLIQFTKLTRWSQASSFTAGASQSLHSHLSWASPSPRKREIFILPSHGMLQAPLWQCCWPLTLPPSLTLQTTDPWPVSLIPGLWPTLHVPF